MHICLVFRTLINVVLYYLFFSTILTQWAETWSLVFAILWFSLQCPVNIWSTITSVLLSMKVVYFNSNIWDYFLKTGTASAIFLEETVYCILLWLFYRFFLDSSVSGFSIISSTASFASLSAYQFPSIFLCPGIQCTCTLFDFPSLNKI